MNIEIVNAPEDPDRLCASGALVSTNKESPAYLYNEKIEDKGKKFLKNLIKAKHHSTLEHANFTISLEGVSVLFEQFLIEHRLASYTVRSRRYVDFSESGYVVPEFFSGEFEDQYDSFMNYYFDLYNELVEEGIPIEDARYILPYTFKSNIICTMNAREVGKLIYDCLQGRGKNFKEFRKIGREILDRVEEKAPILFENYKLYGEGKNGKEEELDNLFGKEEEKEFRKREVELISHTPEPEKTVASSAIMKHTQREHEKIRESLKENKNLKKEVIDKVLENKRMRELEHANFLFRINGISLPALTHFTRHRIWSPVIPSLTELKRSENFIIPETVKEKGLEEKFEKAFEKASEFRKRMKSKGAEKDLAYIFLAGNLIDFTVSANARELYHIFRLRCCERAQWETREVALKMLKEAKKVAPNLFKRAGASCAYYGFCPEGRESCEDLRSVEDYNLNKIDKEIEKIYNKGRKEENKKGNNEVRIGIGVLIQKNGEVLLGKRKGSHGEGTWSLPGGHLEPGENIFECAKREVKEETNLSIVPEGVFSVSEESYSKADYVTIGVKGKLNGGELKIKEPEKVEEWGWFHPSEFSSLNLFKPTENSLKNYRENKIYQN